MNDRRKAADRLSAGFALGWGKLNFVRLHKNFVGISHKINGKKS